MRKRFRLLDRHTRWFWIVVFLRKQWGEPVFEMSLFSPSPADRERGFFIERPNKEWGWEEEPYRGGLIESQSEVWSEDGVREVCSLGHSLT